MKKNYFLTIVTILLCTIVYGQNAVVGTGFSSGWNGGCGFDTSSYTYFSASAGTSYIGTLNANGTGDQYFRFGVDWGGTISQLTITIKLTERKNYIKNCGKFTLSFCLKRFANIIHVHERTASL